jgi:hypothetical protein
MEGLWAPSVTLTMAVPRVGLEAFADTRLVGSTNGGVRDFSRLE